MIDILKHPAGTRKMLITFDLDLDLDLDTFWN